MTINKEKKELDILDYQKNLLENRSYIDLFLNKIFQQAIEMEVSDIHIEPGEKEFRIRVREDGDLLELGKYNLEKYNPLLSRLKIICGLNIAEKRIPQSGRFNGKYKKINYDFRVSIIPTYFGEKISIRVLKRNQVIKSLLELGINKNICNNCFKILKKKSGMILIAGPMGEGKTTTLYSILNEINTKTKNITTIEDPVEYLIEGINQIQCNEDLGLNFSELLKIILRQDSDIIVIGEIRDKTTASVALTASLTGHLILSTIHSKNSISSLKRLQDLGVDIKLLLEGITGILSQHLLRQLCPYCKIIDNDYLEKLKDLNLTTKDLKDKTIYKKSQGCEKCNFKGYIGRIPLVEFLLKKQNLSLDKIKIDNIKEAFKINSLINDGVRLVLEGKISLDELLRVI